jgi:PHD/YefM family antitoxin component YafN of YafNO toxin-antitoxin module
MKYLKGEKMNAQPQYITNAQGEKMSVILSLSDYQELLEDLEDLAAIAERRNEIAQPFEQVLAELGYDISH